MSEHLEQLRAKVAAALGGVELVGVEPVEGGMQATFRKEYRGITIESGQYVPATFAHAFKRMTTRAAAYFDRAQQEIDEDFDALDGHPPTLKGRMKPIGAWLNPKKEETT